MASAMKIIIPLIAAAGFTGAAVTYIVMGILNMSRGKKAAQKGKSAFASVTCGKLWIGIILLILLLTAGILDVTDKTSRLNWKMLGVSWIISAAAGLAMSILFIYMSKHVRFTEEGIFLRRDFIPKNECSYKHMKVSDEKSVYSLYIGKKNALIVTPQKKNEFHDLLTLRYKRADGKAVPHESKGMALPVIVGVGLAAVIFTGYWLTKPVIFVGSTVLSKNWEHAYFCWDWISDPDYVDEENRLGLPCADGWEVQDTSKLTAADMGMLRYMPNLKAINIIHNSVGDLSFLKYHEQLEDFYFGAGKNEKMPELAPLANLKNLRRFVFDNVGVKEFDGFGYLCQLPEMTCMRVEDVIVTREGMADIGKMKKLVLLDLTGSSIETLEGIEQLTELKELCLEGCQLNDPEVLAKCTSVDNLSLMNTNITDFSFLRGMDSVRSLNISQTRPDDYEFLRDMKGLKEIYIHESMHEDMEELLDELHISVFSNE